MPLLKKKQFEKTSTTLLRDEEEVFYCEITGEVFRDYEEFSERLFLCNSMVWTCSMTGKSNLTYQEAVESEENARKSLQEFPVELKIPILFLATKTKRTSFGEMAEDVFIYAKDRYFIGENLETSFTGNKWKDSHVLQVISVPEGSLKQSPPKNGNNSDRNFFPPANVYKYEIEHLDAEDEDVSEIMIVDHSQIRRRKSAFSREKSKLFLKQYVEPDENGIWVVKPSAVEDFGLNKMKFDQIFDGPLPNFFESTKKTKKINGVTNGGKKVTKQETLAKYLTKNGLAGKKEPKSKNGPNLLEQMKKREETFKLKKQMKEEEKQALKQKKKEENIKISAYLKEFYKPKDDLELEDQIKLPVATPVISKIPDKYLGDLFMILEFVNNFSKILYTKDFFPQGFTYDILERAFTEKEVAGPLTDIIQMFLTALFSVQEEESNQYRTQVEKGSEIKEEDVSNSLSLHEATNLATLASAWSTNYQGLPLSKLPLYSVTVSEVLRLHLLSSGARINETGARWRFQQRGGYTSEDDPGLYLRLHEPHIIKALSFHNVIQLSISDKVKIISCLMNQLMTYADVRDVIEERVDKNRQMKMELKAVHVAERKREQEYVTERAKIKRENKEAPKALADELDKLEKSNERKQADIERKMDKCMKACCENQPFLGYDRAFRKYFKLESVPGVFVNFEEEYPGVCLDTAVKQFSELVNADKSQIIQHVKKVYEEMNSSDKENEPAEKVNGTRNSLQQTEKEICNDLLLCSADPKNCIIHSENAERTKWAFFKTAEEIDDLIKALNKRGIRESELLQVLKMDKENLCKLIERTPVAQLNGEIEVEEKPQNRKKPVKDKYEDANLGFPADMSLEDVLHNALIDNILEMEDKIFAGNLGSLAVKNRDKWRECLTNKNYAEIDKTLVKKDSDKHLKIKKENSGKGSRPNTPDPSPEPKEYLDPGRFLGPTLDLDLNSSCEQDDVLVLRQSEELSTAIAGCALALAQVARAVEPKHLKKPLGREGVKKDNKKEICDVLDKWELSLLASTSFSQVFLHYGTLDSCVMWSRSALLARCRICRRRKDSENMLLCDNCNLGHHLYCLKPKLTVVPKGDWFCQRCKTEKESKEKQQNQEVVPRKKRKIFKEEESDVDEEEESDEQNNSEEEENEEVVNGMKVDLCKTCGSGGDLLNCEKCSLYYHRECVSPPMRRAPRGPWTCTKCKEKKEEKASDSESDDEEEEVVKSRRSLRREDNRQDLPLHNVALQELLSDVMKHKDAWPFLRPVQKNEVPDYYDVITKPMDFGTIKYKLNMGEYNEDRQLMTDAILVFGNCNAYNHSEADVYKCGSRLKKFFVKKCKEVGLKVPRELLYEDGTPDDDDDDDVEEEEVIQPKAKRPRTELKT
ncbi:bromodomain adjacent to zinc finger domain protein 1A isoform X2 [Aethina tumida]|uniref:bromodomain adjacent to zinc finger domain protein 1A isoform X2 n=1 Tax=Aethina tumida TaxID=116153 RepID=UPI0021498936|nr:bromodomain adjacent to zinc finger domain protein 1A isoform X2 [Aethina tumida]